MEQHTTLKAEHEALSHAHQQMAIELQKETEDRRDLKQKYEAEKEMVEAKQHNLEQCTMLLTELKRVDTERSTPALAGSCSPVGRPCKQVACGGRHARAMHGHSTPLFPPRLLTLMRSMEDTQAEPGASEPTKYPQVQLASYRPSAHRPGTNPKSRPAV